MNHPIITMVMKNQHSIKMELIPDTCPNGINALLWLIYKGGYDNLTIQRIVPDFVLQPFYDEMRMSEDHQYIIEGEFKNQDIPFTKYSIGLAGDGAKIAAGGCFFIVVGDECDQRLHSKFTHVGHVIEGFDEVERIMHVPLKKIDVGVPGVSVNEPVEPEVIDHIEVELNGYEYTDPDQFLPKFE